MILCRINKKSPLLSLNTFFYLKLWVTSYAEDRYLGESRFQALYNGISLVSGPEVIKLFSTIVGILTFMSRKNSILGLSEPKKC